MVQGWAYDFSWTNQSFLQFFWLDWLESFFSSLATGSENESLELSEGTFSPAWEKSYLEQKQDDNTQKMLREMRGSDSTQVPISRHQGHLYTCHFHNLFMSKKRSWRVVKSVKTDFIQDYFNRGKESSVYSQDHFRKQHGQAGMHSQGTGWGSLDGKLLRENIWGI